MVDEIHQRTERRRKKSLLLRKEQKVIRIPYLDQLEVRDGWVQRTAEEWGVSHTEVRRWIKRFYPEFLEKVREELDHISRIAILLEEGKSRKQIAMTLGLSLRTINWYLSKKGHSEDIMAASSSPV